MKANSIFSHIPENLPEELVEQLVSTDSIRIERIVSQGQVSPDGFWYDQDEHEWVIVLEGEARLRFEGEKNPVELKKGDFINIAAHKKHRVEWTDPARQTVWLAIFYK